MIAVRVRRFWLALVVARPWKVAIGFGGKGWAIFNSRVVTVPLLLCANRHLVKCKRANWHIILFLVAWLHLCHLKLIEDFLGFGGSMSVDQLVLSISCQGAGALGATAVAALKLINSRPCKKSGTLSVVPKIAALLASQLESGR